MEQITLEQLESLSEKRCRHCVSIYLPTHRSDPEKQQDPIRLRNLLRRAEERLIEQGTATTEAKDLLSPARELLDDREFRVHQNDGLAVFVSKDHFSRHRLPVAFRELVIVGDRFHLKPLLPLLGSREYYLLALSQHEVRLLKGSRYGASEIKLDKVPESIGEILGRYDLSKQLHFHTRAPGAGGERTAVYHGQGGTNDAKNDWIRQYLREVDEGLHELLRNERAPLVLAGVEYLFPIYREVNTYAHLLDEGITGNPEMLGPKELQARAWEIVEPVLLRDERAAVEKYRELAGTGRTTNRLEEALPAAFFGRIESLFIADGIEQWGSYDAEKNELRLDGEMKAESEDLIDLTALETLKAGGAVYPVENGQMPDQGPLAAVFRY